MSDDRYVYYDEDGNPVDPADLADFEIVDDAPADPGPTPQAPAPAAPQPAGSGSGGVPKGLIAGVAIGVLLLGGGGAWAANKLGSQNTASDVKAAASEKKNEVEDRAEDKKEEVTRPPLDACQDLSKAMWSGTDAPAVQLAIDDAADLPPGFVDRAGAAGADEIVTLQLGRDMWGIYVPEPAAEDEAANAAPWWRVEAITSEDGITVTEGPGDGGDENTAGACPQASAGTYRAVGDVPAEAQGLKDEQATVAAIQADGGSETSVIAVVGDQVITATLEYVPDDDSEDADES